MKQIEKWQIKAVYALGASLGMVERGNHEDDLHQLVNALCGKSGVTKLSFDEAGEVLTELQARMTISTLTPPTGKPKQHSDSPSGMTEGQQRKVWHQMYQLAELDEKRGKTPLGDRLCGIIKRELHIDATAREPFQWLSYRQGGHLIEVLKKYISSAEQKRMRGGAG